MRSISQVGNHDDLIDWVFTQDSVLRAEVGLAGIDAPKALAGPTPGEYINRFSTPIAAQLVAPNHSHHFSLRLDVDVDGPLNSFMLGHLRQVPAPGPRRALFEVVMPAR